MVWWVSSRGVNGYTLDLRSVLTIGNDESLAGGGDNSERGTFHSAEPRGAHGASPGLSDLLRKTCHSSAFFPILTLCNLYRNLAMITSPCETMITSSDTAGSSKLQLTPAKPERCSNRQYGGGGTSKECGGGCDRDTVDDDAPLACRRRMPANPSASSSSTDSTARSTRLVR